MTARTLDDLGWSQLTEALAGYAQSPRGAEQARALPFLPDQASVAGSLAVIEEARGLLRRQLPMPVGGVEEIRPLVERCQKGAVLAANELKDCADVARAALEARRFVSGLADDVPLLATMVQRFYDLSDLAARVTRTFEPSGNLRDDASYELADYRRQARSLHERIKTRLEKMLQEPELVHRLQDTYYSLRNDRYVLPVKSNFRAQVPGIVHNASQSGQTIFVELDALVPLGNELTIAEALAAEEERRVLIELSQQVAASAVPLLANGALLAQLDVVQAAARFADALDCEVPELVAADAPLLLARARHPLLLIQKKKVVANSLRLDEDELALIISGPNAGGKTVAMTTAGLCLLMTRAGLPIPAAVDSRVPLVTGLSCTIGDAQDLARDLSTFSAHLKALGELLAQAGPGWLCLIDEIGSDTDPVEGAALATAVLEALADQGARILVTTHLEEVKAFGLNDRRFVNGRVGMDPETLQPNYTLELGAAGVSKAIDVAELVGLPAAVIKKARENLMGGGALTAALQKLEEEQQRVAQQRDDLEARLRAAEEEQSRLRTAVVAAEGARREAELRLRQEMAETYEAAAQQAAAAVAALQADASMQQAQETQRLMRARADEQRRALEALQGPKGVARHDKIAVGDQVRIPGLNQIGEVLAVDGDGATVAVGSLRTRAALNELARVGGKSKTKKPRGPDAKKTPRPEPGREGRTDALIPRDATLDLRGQRAGDAEHALDVFLDQSFLANRSPVLLIHGHGTGVLRQLIREALARSKYVADFRAGEEGEGGDGVTVADLRL